MQRWKARGVLGVPDFRRLWLVGLLVSVARWLEMLVIGVLVWERSGSALLVALVTLLRLLPLVLFGVLLGVAADRVQRRTVLIAVLLSQALTAALLAGLALAGRLEVWHLGVACFVAGCAWASENPVRRMMLGEVVGAARMVPAMSLDVVANNASRIAGPALGGTMLAGIGAGAAFGLAFVVYALAVLAALRLAHRSVVEAGRGSVLGETRRSFALVIRAPGMPGVLIVTLVFNLFGFPATSMVPVIGAGSLALAPDGVGLLASMDGLGALLGALAMAALSRPAWHRACYIGGAALYCAMVTGFALAPAAVPAGLALLVMGIGGAGFATMQATLVYTATPPELRSRALGVLSAFVGSGLLGFLHLGLMAEWLGAPAATALLGVEGLLALLLTWRWWRA